MKTCFNVQLREQPADLHSPVAIYLQLRDSFSELLLLESNDYQRREDSYSFICIDALASIQLNNGMLQQSFLGTLEERPLVQGDSVPKILQAFSDRLSCHQPSHFNGLYGHCNFDAVQYFDSPSFDPQKRQIDLPDLRYSFYRFVIAIHHFSHRMYILENIPVGEKSQISRIDSVLRRPISSAFAFQLQGEEQSSLSDEQFRQLVRQAKQHCAVGDVFQLVLSRQFQQAFSGDEFQVYRALRSINPSPYLFYFDYGQYKIFGSSPEAQLVIRGGKASLMPIAGTYKRTGDEDLDAAMAQQLLLDPKENAEHVMLVDLARNDLNRNNLAVKVSEYKTLHYYSHLIHLVSKVEGQPKAGASAFQIFADCFPAGTLSGAPKYKALGLIQKYEPQHRSFYGGAIGFFGLQGQVNQAILIRSFLSYQQKLYYQAGAGIVIDSDPEKELQEVNHKLAALKKALVQAAGESAEHLIPSTTTANL